MKLIIKQLQLVFYAIVCSFKANKTRNKHQENYCQIELRSHCRYLITTTSIKPVFINSITGLFGGYDEVSFSEGLLRIIHRKRKRFLVLSTRPGGHRERSTCLGKDLEGAADGLDVKLLQKVGDFCQIIIFWLLVKITSTYQCAVKAL